MQTGQAQSTYSVTVTAPSLFAVGTGEAEPVAETAGVVTGVTLPSWPVNWIAPVAMFFGPAADTTGALFTFTTTIAMIAAIATMPRPMPPCRNHLLRRLRRFSASARWRATSRAC